MIVVPDSLEYTAEAMFNPAFVNVTTDPNERVLSGKLKVITLSTLTSDTSWYVLDLSK